MKPLDSLQSLSSAFAEVNGDEPGLALSNKPVEPTPGAPAGGTLG